MVHFNGEHHAAIKNKSHICKYTFKNILKYMYKFCVQGVYLHTAGIFVVFY